MSHFLPFQRLLYYSTPTFHTSDELSMYNKTENLDLTQPTTETSSSFANILIWISVFCPHVSRVYVLQLCLNRRPCPSFFSPSILPVCLSGLAPFSPRANSWQPKIELLKPQPHLWPHLIPMDKMPCGAGDKHDLASNGGYKERHNVTTPFNWFLFRNCPHESSTRPLLAPWLDDYVQSVLLYFSLILRRSVLPLCLFFYFISCTSSHKNYFLSHPVLRHMTSTSTTQCVDLSLPITTMKLQLFILRLLAVDQQQQLEKNAKNCVSVSQFHFWAGGVGDEQLSMQDM